MDIGQVCLRRGEELDLAAGSSWIYDNEIAWRDDRCRDGDVVAVPGQPPSLCWPRLFQRTVKNRCPYADKVPGYTH